MIKQIIIGALLSLLLFNSCQEPELKALIVTGQNNHNWEASHEILSRILVNSQVFNVDIAISPGQGEEMSDFNPVFENYDVVVLDYNGDAWDVGVQKRFENYVANGGGVVVYHAADNSFPKWEEYNKMIGLGGWYGRNEASGPYVYWRNDSIIRDMTPGHGGSHGQQHEFVVHHRETDHPILRGLPTRWMHSRDELYSELRGPAENMSVLATAYADRKKGGTGRHEPVLFTVKYGKGRIFHTVLGHVGKEAPLAAQCAGFILTLQRGAEWAATGSVTQELPADLPNVATPFILPSYKPYSLDELFRRAQTFKQGNSRKYLYLISNRIRLANEDQAKLKDFERRIIEVLESNATVDCKNYLCRDLSWIGSDAAIPILEQLQNNDATKDMAAFALQRIRE